MISGLAAAFSCAILRHKREEANTFALIKTLKNGYEITDPDGEKSYFVFDKKHKSCHHELVGPTHDRGTPDIKASSAIHK